MMHGIDISSWQEDISLKNLPIDFVIIKATEGLTYTNPYFGTKAEQARALGLKIGFYHYARTNDAQAEADWFCRNIKPYVGKAILALDYESDAVEQGVSWAKRFLERVEYNTGNVPLIYMSQSVCTRYDWSAIAKRNGLWVAKYPNMLHPDFGYSGELTGSIGAWEFAAIWQYASDGRIKGYGGDLDLNRAFMNKDAWDKYAAVQTATNIDKNGNGPLVVSDGEWRVTVEKVDD